MAKKRLSEQQQKRIASHRKISAHAFPADTELGEAQQGIVIEHYGTQVEVEAWPFTDSHYQKRCHLRSNLAKLSTGDHVIWRDHPQIGVVESLLTRRNAIERPDRRGQLNAIAANVDQLIILIAPQPAPQTSLIDRYLILAELNQVQPILVCNKIDLLTEEDERVKAIFEIYSNIGYATPKISTLTQQGIPKLLELLTGKTNVLVGQSGVGKSSITNLLLPNAQAATTSLSEKSGLGAHTTTSTRIYHLPSGGALMDSPGIRDLGLNHLNAETILDGFVELAPLRGQCQFRNCQHRHEPNCAFLDAVQNGTVHKERLGSFLDIISEIGH